MKVDAGMGSTGRKRAAAHLMILLVGLLCLVLLGTWSYRSLRDNLAGQIGAELQRILNANVAGLKIWIEDEKGDVQVAAGDPEVRRLVSQLQQQRSEARGIPLRLGSAPQQARLREALSPAVADPDYWGFIIIDTAGVVLATDTLAASVGLKVSAPLWDELQKVWSGQTVFVRPLAMSGLRHQSAGIAPAILVAAPLRDAVGGVMAALTFAIKPEDNFSRILSAARAGDSGDTYAFDGDGFLLSEPRHKEQLKSLGLLPSSATGGSVLAVQVRDPGGDLTRGFRLQEPLARRPLTRMAMSAVKGESGADIAGYRDYRGVRVIGAWRWLPEYGFGIATEWEYAEVMRALKPVRYLFWGSVATLLILSLFSAAASWWIRRLRRRIGALSELGQYTLLEKIGEGGIGEVYRARHALLRRPTAIKLIRPDAADASTLARFEREAQITSELTHPNTVSVFDYGRTPEGVFYYAMEYLPGVTLQKLVELEGALPEQRVIHILCQVCASLHEAHGCGLVHRDINPKNVILCERGGIYDFAKVLDFGMVKDVAAPAQEGEAAAHHYVFGAPGFVAPERLTAPGSVGISSDLYSLGALGYFLLTSETVLASDFSYDIYSDIVRCPARRPSKHAPRPVPPELDDLIFACLQKDPTARPASAEEIRRRLQEVPAGKWSEEDARMWWRENAQRLGKLELGKQDSDGAPPGKI